MITDIFLLHFSIPLSTRLPDKEPADHPGPSTSPSSTRPKIADGSGDGIDIFGAKPSFSVGTSSPPNGVTAPGGNFVAGGLGEGTPKVGSVFLILT